MIIGTYYPKLVIDISRFNNWFQDITDSVKCRSCNVSLFCGGACAYNNLLQNKSINEPVCKNCHETIEEYIKSIEYKFTLEDSKN
ncbi:hypothetical protein D3C77_649930 [compost metagenome]